MNDTMKPSEEPGAKTKGGNVEYNPVNMAGKKADGVKERDKKNAKVEILPSNRGDGNAVGTDPYNPVNMAGRKADGKKGK